MTGYAEMRAAVLAYIGGESVVDPLDIHWVLPLKLRRDVPEVRGMPGTENDVLVMIRGILAGWYLRGPGKGQLPPAPPEARDPRDPRRRAASAR